MHSHAYVFGHKHTLHACACSFQATWTRDDETPIIPSTPIPALNFGFTVLGITLTAGFEAGLNFIMNQELTGQIQFISTFGYQAGKRFSAQVRRLPIKS